MRLRHCAAAAVLVWWSLTDLQPAHAEQFKFSYSLLGTTPGKDVSARGILTTTALDPSTNSYRITAITGTRTSQGITQTITGLLAPGAFQGNDNLLYAGSLLLDHAGLSFTVDSLGHLNTPNVNVNHRLSQAYTEGVATGSGIFTVTPVPELSTLLSFGSLVFLGCLVAVHQRKSLTGHHAK